MKKKIEKITKTKKKKEGKRKKNKELFKSLLRVATLRHLLGVKVLFYMIYYTLHNQKILIEILYTSQ